MHFEKYQTNKDTQIIQIQFLISHVYPDHGPQADSSSLGAMHLISSKLLHADLLHGMHNKSKNMCLAIFVDLGLTTPAMCNKFENM